MTVVKNNQMFVLEKLWNELNDGMVSEETKKSYRIVLDEFVDKKEKHNKKMAAYKRKKRENDKDFLQCRKPRKTKDVYHVEKYDECTEKFVSIFSSDKKSEAENYKNQYFANGFLRIKKHREKL